MDETYIIDHENDSIYEFFSDNFELKEATIADIYRQQWQIEVLFKRRKPKFLPKYFPRESQNAIEVRIICVLVP